MDIDPAWLETDLYEVLGVDADAPTAEITRAYRRLARALHPDTNPDAGAEQRFAEASTAHDVLRDPEKRAAYDRSRQVARSGARRRPGGGYTIRVDKVSDVGIRDRPRRSMVDDLFGVSPRRPGTGRRRGPGRIFGRAGDDLTVTVPVTYSEAALGADIAVPTVDGDAVTVRLPPGTPTGRVLRVRGRGVPTERGRGDLLVSVRVDVPRHLDDRQRELLRELADHDDPGLRDHLWT